MHIIGVDFSSRPSKQKPITCAHFDLENDLLSMKSLEVWNSFDGFEHMLRHPGPWIAGIDFPFGQARRFIENIGWPDNWHGYVQHAHSLGRAGFRQALDQYRLRRAYGDKEHRRKTDCAASSISPQKLYGVPVGLMFFEGAPRLIEAGVHVPHLMDGDKSRITVESYPGVLARNLIGKLSYKSDTTKKQSLCHLQVRHRIIDNILNGDIYDRYGFCVKADKALCEDPSGDHLDALLCAIQAAWAWLMRRKNFGAPSDVDPLEGWIADPSLASRPAQA